MFENLELIPNDPLLAISGQFNADTRSDKVDLGVGVYRDDSGKTPIMASVKKAEQSLVETQDTKAYIGMLGSASFVDEITKLTFDDQARDDSRMFGMQTIGGSAALRLAADLIRRSNPHARVWLGLPSWLNHYPILKEANLQIATFPYYNARNQEVNFTAMMAALKDAARGDTVLIQACCHNPTGCDLNIEQWQEFADLCNERGLIPFIDSAYQGLGDGLKEDRAGMNLIAKSVPEAIFTISCSKNFGLYRERTGALFVLAENASAVGIAKSQLFSIARANYSMPPDHGAAVVSAILTNAELRSTWENELTEMRERILATRETFIEEWGDFRYNVDFLRSQKGMFSILPLNSDQVVELKDGHSVYTAPDGRMNMAGLKNSDIPRVVDALQNVIKG